jgi:pyrroloquinoline-quinone synthase
MTFQAKLLQLVEERHLLKHPFYLAWTMGELSKENLGHYAIQYFPHVEAFPRFVSSIHGLCEDAASRRVLFENLSEEEGSRESESHPALWLDFAQGLGVDRSRVYETEKKAQAVKLKDLYLELCRSSYAEGLGALTAYEMQIPQVAEAKIDGLKRFYGITDAQTLAFFEIHKQADQFHSESCMKLLESLSEPEQERALKSASRALNALWDFLSEVYSECLSPGSANIAPLKEQLCH